MARNLPWAGALGRVADRCIYCVEMGHRFQMSSHPTRCLRCPGGPEPLPELLAAHRTKVEALARAYCAERGWDYDAILAERGLVP
jgi:putative hemolysin